MRSWKIWSACAAAAVVAGGLMLLSPRLGGIAVILIVLGTLGAFAYRSL